MIKYYSIFFVFLFFTNSSLARDSDTVKIIKKDGYPYIPMNVFSDSVSAVQFKGSYYWHRKHRKVILIFWHAGRTPNDLWITPEQIYFQAGKYLYWVIKIDSIQYQTIVEKLTVECIHSPGRAPCCLSTLYHPADDIPPMQHERLYMGQSYDSASVAAREAASYSPVPQLKKYYKLFNSWLPAGEKISLAFDSLYNSNKKRIAIHE